MHVPKAVPTLVAVSMLAACAGTSPLAPPAEIPEDATLSNAGIWVPPPEPPEWPIDPPPRELPPVEQPPHETSSGR
jgi:hypothetical protein